MGACDHDRCTAGTLYTASPNEHGGSKQGLLEGNSSLENLFHNQTIAAKG